jgi:hypothetical protein
MNEMLEIGNKIIVASPVPPPPMSKFELLLEHRILGKVVASGILAGCLFTISHSIATGVTPSPMLGALLGAMVAGAGGFVWQVSR